MPAPTILARLRQTLGRALRETGQALDRVGVRGRSHAETTRQIGDDPYKFQDHLSRHRNQMPLLNRGSPTIDENVAMIAPCSALVGDVHVGENSSIWYGAILRADECHNGMGHSEEVQKAWRQMTKEQRKEENWVSGAKDSGSGGSIIIGKNTNIQDGCVITARDDHTQIGDYVTVGHCAQIHSSSVQDFCLIGMGAILQSGSVIQTKSFVAAGAVIGKGETVKSGELWVGNPARKIRDLTQAEQDKLSYQADQYVAVARGQTHVMELGGNVPDSLIEHLLIPVQQNKDEKDESSKQKTQPINHNLESKQ